MDEDFLDVTQSSKKVVVVFILVIFIIGVLGYFFVFKKFYFSLKTVKHELGTTLSENVEDYLGQSVKDSSLYKLDISNVNKDEVGEYTYTVTYKKSKKKGKVVVRDTTPPEFTLNEMVIEEGTVDYYLGDFLESCDDLSTPCLVELKDSKDESQFGIVGNHSIDILVKDLYGNKKSATGSLKVVSKGTYVDPKSQDLEYVKNSLEIENFKGEIYEKLEKAINKDSDAARDKMSEISTIDLEEYVKSKYEGSSIKTSEIIELYNKYDYVIGYSIRLTLDDGRTVYVTKE